jgi:hypothetical protein
MNACIPDDLMAAVQACLSHAKSDLYRNIGDVADAMDTKPTREAVYKWVQTGRLPLAEIPAFERACASSHISKYIAACGGYLIVRAPVADGLPQLEFARIQCQVAKAILATSTALVDAGQAPDAVNALTVAINSLAAVRHQLTTGGAK